MILLNLINKNKKNSGTQEMNIPVNTKYIYFFEIKYFNKKYFI